AAATMFHPKYQFMRFAATKVSCPDPDSLPVALAQCDIGCPARHHISLCRYFDSRLTLRNGTRLTELVRRGRIPYHIVVGALLPRGTRPIGWSVATVSRAYKLLDLRAGVFAGIRPVVPQYPEVDYGCQDNAGPVRSYAVRYL